MLPRDQSRRLVRASGALVAAPLDGNHAARRRSRRRSGAGGVDLLCFGSHADALARGGQNVERAIGLPSGRNRDRAVLRGQHLCGQLFRRGEPRCVCGRRWIRPSGIRRVDGSGGKRRFECRGLRGIKRFGRLRWRRQRWRRRWLVPDELHERGADVLRVHMCQSDERYFQLRRLQSSLRWPVAVL
jgi:hypothetical protein